MRIIDAAQGSDAWLAHRRGTRNASDAPAMMGASPYVTRAELIRQRATGIEREIDPATQYIFDKGHAVEPALRARAESFIGEDLYPITGTDDAGYLGASFDGVTMDEATIFEAKQSNAQKQAHVERGIIPPTDYWQIVQQFAVCETAEKCHYSVGDGVTGADMMIHRTDVADDIPKLLAGWAQFDADVAAYQVEPEVLPPAAGRAPDQLPALRVDVTGMVTFSNLAEFKAGALAVLGSINRDLQTDADFADAEQTVKWAKGVEDRLDAAKAQALSQTADIEAVFRTIDEVSAETRRVRLDLDKLVKARKESIKAEVVAAGCAAVRAHFDGINATLGQHAFQPPQTLQLNIGAAIKGMRSIQAMRDAVDAAVAGQKIEASQHADAVRANMAILAEHPDHASLFADRVALCATKAPDDLRNLVSARIAEHRQREAAKVEAERERIRREEIARIEREQAAEAERAAKESRSATPAPVATPAAAASVSASPAPTVKQYAMNPSNVVRIKLGDINARIAPLTITADGLAQLGFQPVGTERSAKLYNLADLPIMCEHMRRCLASAASMKEAA
jgi:putative phage-type endonuclease